MDVSFSAKSQTLSLISCFSLPSSSSPSSFSRSCSVQREFLGSGHRLRPPGLTSRRRSNKLGFENRRHRFLLRASLLSRPLVVIVAVAAAFSAFTVVYLNYVRRRKDVRELSGSKDLTSLQDLELSKQWRGLLMQHIEKQILDCGEINEEIPVIARKSEIEKTNDNDMPAEKRDVQNQRTALIHEETLVSGTLELCGSTKEDESEGLNLTSSVVADEFTLPEPIDFTIKMPEFLPETSPVKAVLLSELPGEVIELESSASSVSLRLETIETSEGDKPRHEVGKGIEFPYSGQEFLLKASSREELYTFYEENKSGTRTMLSLSNLKPTSPGSLQHSTRLSPLLSPNILKGMELATQGSFHTSGNLEGQIPLACYREGSYIKAKEMGKGWEFPQDVRKRLPPQNIPSNRVKSPQPNGKCTTNKHDSSEYLRTYNCLLRDGRLPDCIELLESMEQRGLLDMDKIYHAKFFNTCKSQKAVKEAFHFINLIGNPALSTFNMLLSVCSSAQDSEGAFKVLQLVKEAGLKADCKLYTNLISTCAKSGKVDPMFEVFHEMVNAGVEPNLHTYGALIDGCARAGQVAKAFGAYGILRSKKVKPDRVVFNALITACGQSGAVDRAFDVLAEMKAEPTPVDPDHVTVGALIKTCAQAGEFDRAREVYKMIHQYNIKGTPEVYTIAVNSCSQTGDLDFALKVYEDMARNGVVPDEMFVSALMDVAGHAGKIDVAFKVLQEARIRGTRLGNVAYSSLMGACSNAENWQKALEVYEDIKAIKLQPTTSTLNALVTALCNGDQLGKAVEVLTEMKKVGVCPNSVTYTILSVASEKKDELETGLMLYSQAKKDGVVPYNITCKCLISMCLRRFEKAYSLGEQIITFNSGKTQIDNKWTSLALTIYREAIIARVVPSMKVLSLVLGCLQFPHDTSLRARFIENLGVFSDVTRYSNMYSLLNGFGEYDPRSFSLLEEAASLGIVPCVSFKGSPIVVDARKFQIHAAEVYLITVLKGLKHQLAADASVKLPNLTVLLPVEKTQIQTPKGEKTIKLAGRVAQAVGALLRRLGLPYQGNESYGKIRITGLAMKRWFQPKFASPFIGSNPSQLNSLPMRLAKGILDQQRNIRTSNLSLD